jgi:hypothetical protein
MKRLLLLAALALACGSSPKSTTTNPPPAPGAAQGLDYQDPAGSGWRLVRHASSTPNRLVLELHGPAGERTRGAGLNLQGGPGVRFGAFASGLAVENGEAYALGSVDSLDPNEPVAIAGGVLPNNVLSVGVYQKDRGWPARDSGAALLRIIVQFDPSASLASGTSVALSVLKAKVIPEDIGGVNDDPYVLQNKLRMKDVPVAIGKVVAL